MLIIFAFSERLLRYAAPQMLPPCHYFRHYADIISSATFSLRAIFTPPTSPRLRFLSLLIAIISLADISFSFRHFHFIDIISFSFLYFQDYAISPLRHYYATRHFHITPFADAMPIASRHAITIIDMSLIRHFD
jgi:hypothetical protein